MILLTSNPGEIFIKEDIITEIWEEQAGGESSLTNGVYQLRKTFRELGGEQLIQTVPRRGYRFVGHFSKIQPNKRDTAIALPDTASLHKTAPNDISQHEESGLVLWKAGRLVYVGYSFLAVLCIGLAIVGGFLLWERSDHAVGEEIGSIRSIAVLPIRSYNETDADLSLRITDSLTSRLGSVERIAVRPTSAVLRFVGQETDSMEAGRRLKVDAVFEGYLQTEGERLRLSLHVISAKSGKTLWSDHFDGNKNDLLALQDNMSEELVRLLTDRLTKKDSIALAKLPTQIPEAYENYLKGRFFWQKRSYDGLLKAVSFFERAVELDPEFADAYVGLADSHYLIYDYSYDTSPEIVDRAKTAIKKAIVIDANLPASYVTMGLIQTTFEWDWNAAETSLATAISLKPDFPDALHRRAMLYLKMGRFSEAEADIRRALEIDPTSQSMNMNLGLILYFSGQYDAAEKQLKDTMEMDRVFVAPLWYLARCLWQKGDINGAFDVYIQALRSTKDTALADELEELMVSKGMDAVLKVWSERWKQRGMNDHSIAILASYQRDTEQTIRLLESAFEARHPWIINLNVEPDFLFLRQDPRFKRMISLMRFPTENKSAQ